MFVESEIRAGVGEEHGGVDDERPPATSALALSGCDRHGCTCSTRIFCPRGTPHRALS